MDKLIRYWDSDCFLGWFNEESSKIDQCKGVLTKARNGELLIVTSALTLTEVIRLKGKPRISKENEDKIVDFFENDFISIRNVGRITAEKARHLLWTYNRLMPKDSIHRELYTYHT